MRRTWGSETSQYPEEEKSSEIPSVAASEGGRAQTDPTTKDSKVEKLHVEKLKKTLCCLLTIQLFNRSTILNVEFFVVGLGL